MTDAVRRCPDHGPFAGGGCPDCGAAGSPVLGGDRRTRLSKFLSGALRHFPADVGLTLDDHGWTPWADLVAAAADRYGWADGPTVAAVVATDPKGRFERDGDRVRAAYGHSVDVDLDAPETPVPDTLYHGTAPENLDAIRAEGLRPMGRQQVHLSGTVEAAREVGRRHAADPVVLSVDAAALRADGHRVVKRGRDVYTVARVPPEYVAGAAEA
ncbi:MAG: RNA 2'-phosphotransferase [Haloferacaceae archaeon]